VTHEIGTRTCASRRQCVARWRFYRRVWNQRSAACLRRLANRLELPARLVHDVSFNVFPQHFIHYFVDITVGYVYCAPVQSTYYDNYSGLALELPASTCIIFFLKPDSKTVIHDVVCPAPLSYHFQTTYPGFWLGFVCRARATIFLAGYEALLFPR